MSIVVYNCDTCKREIELPQNINGLEVMSRCIITDGCKGSLIQTQVKTSHVRGKLPAPDTTGLLDWNQRRLYFKMEQPTALNSWKVVHNLGSNPSVQVWITLADGRQIETSDVEVVYKNPFEVELNFPEPRSGNVQCMSRTSSSGDSLESVNAVNSVDTPSVNISGGLLSLAVPLDVPLVDLDLRIGFVSTLTNLPIMLEPITFSSQTSSLSPWWKQSQTGITRVFFSKKNWNVATANINNQTWFTSGISNGTPFFFTCDAQMSPVPPSTVFVLLSNSPYLQYDRDHTNVIDINKLSYANALANTSTIGDQLLVSQSMTQRVFPPIILI